MGVAGVRQHPAVSQLPVIAMPAESRPLPPAGELWARYSYNPLTGTLHSLRRPSLGSLGTNARYPQLSINGFGNFYLHRVIWKWVTGRDPEHTIDHINRNVRDNRFTNLRDATHLEQTHNRSNMFLTPAIVQLVRQRFAAGERQAAIARSLGLNDRTVGQLCRHERWKHITTPGLHEPCHGQPSRA